MEHMPSGPGLRIVESVEAMKCCGRRTAISGWNSLPWGTEALNCSKKGQVEWEYLRISGSDDRHGRDSDRIKRSLYLLPTFMVTILLAVSLSPVDTWMSTSNVLGEMARRDTAVAAPTISAIR